MSDCPHRHGSRFCPDCGKDLAPLPYDRRTLLSDLVENWWEKGAVQTLAGLFVRPGLLIRTYIERDRDLLVKPIPYAAIVIAFCYWVRARAGLGGISAGDSATMALLLRDPLVLTLLAALIGAAVVTFITHRPAPLSFYGAFVLRLYIGVQALLLAVGIDLLAHANDARSSLGYDIARYAISFGWVGFALWQYFLPDALRRNALRAAAAVLLGEIGLILLIVIPVLISDEMGWLA
jgi:Protein of unknown function (DUF3667)